MMQDSAGCSSVRVACIKDELGADMRYAGAWLFCGDGCLSIQPRPALCQILLLLPLQPRFVTASDSQPWIIFMNIPLPLGLPCLWCVYTMRLNRLSKLFRGHGTCGRACHYWWQVDGSRDVGSRRESVAWLFLQHEMTEQQIQQTGSEFSRKMILWAMLSASVALDRDDIWRQTEGIAFLSAACGIKKKKKQTAWCQKLFLFSPSTCSSTPDSLSPRLFPSWAHMFSPPCH